MYRNGRVSLSFPIRDLSVYVEISIYSTNTDALKSHISTRFDSTSLGRTDSKIQNVISLQARAM